MVKERKKVKETCPINHNFEWTIYYGEFERKRKVKETVLHTKF